MSIKCPSNVRDEPSIETDVNVTVLSDSLQRNPSATMEVEVEVEVGKETVKYKSVNSKLAELVKMMK